jgi:alpha-glucosidase
LIKWRKAQPQLTRGDIVFFDAPEPILALRRDVAGMPAMLAIFNLGSEPVRFAWAEAKGATAVGGHGLAGDAVDGAVTLPGFGGWFGQLAV